MRVRLSDDESYSSESDNLVGVSVLIPEVPKMNRYDLCGTKEFFKV